MPRRLLQLGAAVLTLAAAVAAAVGVVWAWGATIPVEHEVTRSAVLPAAPEEVWSLVAEPERSASWRPWVDRIEPLEPVDGRLRWREHGSDPLTIEVRSSEPPHRLVTAVVEHPDFGGVWTWQLEPAEGGTRLTITEAGEVYNPIFRVMMRHVFGEASTVDSTLQALGAHYDHDVRIE